MTIYNGQLNGAGQNSIRYYEGVGTTGSLAEYITNGAVASDVNIQCKAVYRYIVEQFNYKYDNQHAQPEIWYVRR
jgi:hypothetical protein